MHGAISPFSGTVVGAIPTHNLARSLFGKEGGAGLQKQVSESGLSETGLPETGLECLRVIINVDVKSPVTSRHGLCQRGMGLLKLKSESECFR